MLLSVAVIKKSEGEPGNHALCHVLPNIDVFVPRRSLRVSFDSNKIGSCFENLWNIKAFHSPRYLSSATGIRNHHKYSGTSCARSKSCQQCKYRGCAGNTFPNICVRYNFSQNLSDNPLLEPTTEVLKFCGSSSNVLHYSSRHVCRANSNVIIQTCWKVYKSEASPFSLTYRVTLRSEMKVQTSLHMKGRRGIFLVIVYSPLWEGALLPLRSENPFSREGDRP